jgi:hypothetical protein
VYKESNRKMATEKLKIITRLKIKPGPINKLKTIKTAMNSCDQITEMTKISRLLVLKFLTPLTLSVEKIVKLHGQVQIKKYKCII